MLPDVPLLKSLLRWFLFLIVIMLIGFKATPVTMSWGTKTFSVLDTTAEPVKGTAALSSDATGQLAVWKSTANLRKSAQHSVTLQTIVSIRASADTVAEGETGTFRISRKGSVGALTVSLLIGGNASFNSDYTIEEADSFDASHATVTIADGQTFVDLKVNVVDDISAEADETIILKVEYGSGYTADTASHQATIVIPQNDIVVTSTGDDGEGSLRQAILNANVFSGPDAITFDPQVFAEPQTIILASELPELVGELTINGYIPDRLWHASGVTISGAGQRRVFSVSDDAQVTLRYLTVADGSAATGGGVSNRGMLVVKGVTFVNNEALEQGGGLANLGGTVTVINSTFAENTAVDAGGGFANLVGTATVTNCTFSENAAMHGGGFYSNGDVLLRNTILANSKNGEDCVAVRIDPGSTHNLIEANKGCGTPISTEDPKLQALAYFNGPTKTYALSSNSEAINLGDNTAAVDEHGEPLVWDQRGGGDPRFVSGYTDIGAFEHQRLPFLSVDTVKDTHLRGCTPIKAGDCPLRGAIELANASNKPAVITFDPTVFATQRTLMFSRPLPEVTVPLTLDAEGTGSVTLAAEDILAIFRIVAGVRVEFIHVAIQQISSPKD